jgi:hypothetical protein
MIFHSNKILVKNKLAIANKSSKTIPILNLYL